MSGANSTTQKNISLLEEGGDVVAHAPDCAVVHEHRVAGRMIMNMLECQEPLPPGVKTHSCLKEK